MDAILLGIDGTGVINKADYRGEMRNSFVSYIVRRTPAKLRKYVRGPGMDGCDMSIIVEKAYAFVHLSVAARPKARCFLPGTAVAAPAWLVLQNVSLATESQ